MYSVVLANGEEAKVKEIPTHSITVANNAILPLRYCEVDENKNPD